MTGWLPVTTDFHVPEFTGSKPSPAVVSLGKTLYLSFGKGKTLYVSFGKDVKPLVSLIACL